MQRIKWIKYTPDEDKKEESGGIALLSIGNSASKQNKNNLVFDENVPFNFYTVITDFIVDDKVLSIVCGTDGVEVYNPVSKYRFVVSIAPLFDDKTVIQNVNKKLLDYLKINEQRESIQLNEEQKNDIDTLKEQINLSKPNWDNAYTRWYAGYTKHPFAPFFVGSKCEDTVILKNFARFIQTQISIYDLEILDKSV